MPLPDPHLFDAKAADWDSPVHVERAIAIARSIRSAVPVTGATRVIEVGAGTGLLGRALAPHVGSVLITDPATGMLRAADEALTANGIANARTRRFDLEADPVPGERFDLAVSLMALHHVLDTDAALARLAAMLEPGGWLAVADLDAEDGSFHVDPEERAIVLPGHDRDQLGARAVAAGFVDVTFSDVWQIPKNDRVYQVFLLVARRP